MNLVCMHCLYENFNVIKWFTFCLHAATASGLFFRFCFLQLEVAGPHCHRVSSFRNESVLLVCREILCSAHFWSAGSCKWSCRACCETGNSWRFVFFFPPGELENIDRADSLKHTHTLNRAVKSFDWSVIALLHKMPNARQAWRISLQRRLTLSL